MMKLLSCGEQFADEASVCCGERSMKTCARAASSAGNRFLHMDILYETHVHVLYRFRRANILVELVEVISYL